MALSVVEALDAERENVGNYDSDMIHRRGDARLLPGEIWALVNLSRMFVNFFYVSPS